MKTVVVSQPMFLPWVGLFEQIKLADIYYHYDDVQYPVGRSFMSRVQLRSEAGQSWLTAPIQKPKGSALINEIEFSDATPWKKKHLETIRHLYRRAPFFDEMFELINEVYSNESSKLSDFNSAAIEKISGYLGLPLDRFRNSSSLGLSSSSSQRLFEICRHENAGIYVTGLGALNYLDHDLFEKGGVSVEYMDYQKRPYQQRFEPFIPYVSIIDLIANCGNASNDFLVSNAVDRFSLIDK